MDKKSILKNELISNLRSISILLLVVFSLYKGLSITEFLKLRLNDDLAWAIDFSIYSALLSIIYSCIHYLIHLFIKQRMININVEIINLNERSSSIILRDRDNESVEIKMHIEGKYRHIPKDIKIVFPYWVDIQPRPKPYIKESNDTSNLLFIDINYLIQNKQCIDLTESITVDLIANSDEDNKESVKAILDVNKFNEIFRINFSSEKIYISID